jgi:predicted GNAT family acetyltransferase
MNETEYTLTDNTEAKKFEMKVEGYTAYIEYMLMGNKIFFTHTEVPVPLEGKGIGSKLVKLALENIDSRGLKLVPLCPFTAQYIKRHPEWERVLASDVTLK